MKKEKDSRVNTRHFSLKEYGLLFFTLAAFNGFHMWLYQEFLDRGFLETNIQFVINFLIGYIAIVAACITGIVAFVRYISWSRPMRKLSAAARKIAQGDFTVRITSQRKDGKKDYVEVMFDDFNTMAEELSTIETLKDDFIANVSHEIKTPLSVIQNYATALQMDSLQENERKEYITIIIEATKNLTTLVTNILKMNRLENQEIIQKAPLFDLGEQLRRCALVFEDLWEQKNIRFEADLDEVKINYDESLLEIIWNNLLSNAVKFTNPEGKILLSLKAQDGFALVSVTDSGIGIDKNIQKRIFDKFFQGDGSRAIEGNGLGLALVKKTVELVGGTITVDSAPGHGATFTVSLKI